MDKSSWKDKYSQKQLEKKRWLDRRNRKRARQQSKLTAAELEEQLQLVLTGEPGALISRLRQENARLHARLAHYQSKVELLVLAGREMLEADETLDTENDWNLWDEHREPDSCRHGALQSNTQDDEALLMGAYPTMPADCLSAESVLCEVFSFCQRLSHQSARQNLPSALSNQQLLEYVMTWKLFSGNVTAGFEVLIERFSLDKSPYRLSKEKVRRYIANEDFHQSLLEHLLHNKEIFDEPEQSPSGEPPSLHLPELERQQRAVAICAYESVRLCRELFKTNAEYVTMFWAQYRFYSFLVFPTYENLAKCPPWHRPRLTQLMHNHPSFIDFLVWPELREELVKHWDRYEPQQLLVDLIRNFKMRHVSCQGSPIIKLAPDSSDLQLDEGFESAMFNLESYFTLAPFQKRYPELASLVLVPQNLPHEPSNLPPGTSIESRRPGKHGMPGNDPRREYGKRTPDAFSPKWRAMTSVLNFRKPKTNLSLRASGRSRHEPDVRDNPSHPSYNGAQFPIAHTGFQTASNFRMSSSDSTRHTDHQSAPNETEAHAGFGWDAGGENYHRSFGEEAFDAMMVNSMDEMGTTLFPFGMPQAEPLFHHAGNGHYD